MVRLAYSFLNVVVCNTAKLGIDPISSKHRSSIADINTDLGILYIEEQLVKIIKNNTKPPILQLMFFMCMNEIK